MKKLNFMLMKWNLKTLCFLWLFVLQSTIILPTFQAYACVNCITDLLAPTFDTTPSNLTVECDGSGNTTDLETWLTNNGDAVASDNCSATTDITWHTNPADPAAALSDECGATGTVNVYFIATDECSRSDSSIATFTIEDTTLPTFPQSAINDTVECDGNGNTTELNDWLAAHGNATANDACGSITWRTNPTDPASLMSDDCAETGRVEVYFVATDECGEADSTSALFIIEDTNAPTFTTAASDVRVECDATTIGGQFSTFISTRGGAVATDECSNDANLTWRTNPATPNLTDAVSTCGLTLNLTVYFVVEDECGNADSTAAVFAVEDTTAPVIDPEARDSVLVCTGTVQTTAFEEWITLHGRAMATDNCTSDDDIRWETNPETPVLDGICDTVVVDFIALDECDNPDTSTAAFIVYDPDPLALDMPAEDLVLECNGLDRTAELNVWLGTNGGATIMNECGLVTWTNDFDYETNTCSGDQKGVTFTATDGCGNSVSTMARFIINDTEPPILLTEASDMTIPCNRFGNDEAILQTWLSTHGGATAVDSCSMVNWNYRVEHEETCEPGDFTGKYTVTFFAFDFCQNVDSTTAVFEVIDEIPPVFDYYPVAVVDANCNTIPIPTAPTATDNCTGSVTVTLETGEHDMLCTGHFTIARVWTATDKCGNTSKAIQHIRVRDDEPPYFVSHPGRDAQVQCPEDVPPPVTNVIADDNCTYPVAVVLTEDTIDVNPCGFTIVRTWTATDDCGNQATEMQVVIVLDERAPALIGVPNNIVIANESQIPAPAPVTAIDNCDGEIPVSFTETQTESEECGKMLTIVRTWTAVDKCGLETIKAQTIIVQDTEAPVFEACQTTERVFCSHEIVSFETPIATDNCTPNINVQQIEGLHSGDDFPIGTTQICFEGQDEAQNSTGQCCFNILVIQSPEIERTTDYCNSESKIAYEFTLIDGLANVDYTFDASIPAGNISFSPSSGAVGTIFTITMDPDVPIGTTVTIVVADEESCTIEHQFEVDRDCCIAEAGSLAVLPMCPTDNITTNVMNEDGSASFQQDPNYNYIYLLINSEGNIIATSNTGIFEGFEPADYSMVTLSIWVGASSSFAPTAIVDATIEELTGILPTGCFDLSNAVSFTVPRSLTAPMDENISEGNNGGITPFFYNTHRIEIDGGTPPYDFDWYREGYVRHQTRPDTEQPGVTIDISYSDQAVWGLTVTDANGCTNEDWEFGNQLTGGQSGGILEITEVQITPVGNSANPDGELVLTIDGGCPPYQINCSGPLQFSMQETNDGTAPLVMSNLSYGWYQIRVTDAGGQVCSEETEQVTQGWYWMPHQVTTSGNGFIRGKLAELTTANTIFTAPNPFQDNLTISFNVGEESYGRIDIYDTTGKLVKHLYEGPFNGDQSQMINYQGAELANGIYFVQLTTDKGINVTKKIVKVLTD